jgi:hypothetical protein
LWLKRQETGFDDIDDVPFWRCARFMREQEGCAAILRGWICRFRASTSRGSADVTSNVHEVPDLQEDRQPGTLFHFAQLTRNRGQHGTLLGDAGLRELASRLENGFNPRADADVPGQS